MGAEAKSGGARRYEALDSLRGVAACMVVLYHFHTTGWLSGLSFVRNSFMFVDFFFVLSGFVITIAYRDRLASGFSIKRFMGLRMGRIYPLHLFMLGIMLLVQLWNLTARGPDAAFQGGMSLPAFFASLTLIQNFVLEQPIVWNSPSWSIAVEIWTYLLFAAAFRILRAPAFLVIACLTIAAASCAYVAATQPGYIEAYRWGAFFRCTYGFSLGVIGALLCSRAGSFRPGRYLDGAMEVAVAIAILFFVALTGGTPYSLLAPPLFLVAVLIFAREAGPVSRLLMRPIPRLLGTLSYSIYLVHLFILFRVDTGVKALERIAGVRLDILCETTYSCSARGSALLGDAVLLPVLLLTIGVSWVTWRFVELPGQAWSRRLFLHRKEAAEPEAAVEQKAPAF